MPTAVFKHLQNELKNAMVVAYTYMKMVLPMPDKSCILSKGEQVYGEKHLQAQVALCNGATGSFCLLLLQYPWLCACCLACACRPRSSNCNVLVYAASACSSVRVVTPPSGASCHWFIGCKQQAQWLASVNPIFDLSGLSQM